MSAGIDVCKPLDAPGCAAAVPPPDVLLVEDDDSVRDSLKMMFESHGLTVRDYASAAALLLAGTPRAGCFVIDYHLPGMNGLDLLATLRGKGTASPAILITGRTKVVKRLRAAATGAMAVLEKPFGAVDLLHLVDMALGRPEGPRA